MLNRAALIVRPKQPYLDWAAGLDESSILPGVDDDQTVYLVPEFDDDAAGERMIRRVYAEIFERELFSWHTDESAWPAERTYRVFTQWFHTEMHTVVEDLCDEEIVDDEDDLEGA